MSKVITYKNEGANGIFSQIMFDDGDRILISIANNEIKIFKMDTSGNVPIGVAWEFPSLFNFSVLIQQSGFTQHPLDVLIAKIADFDSIKTLQKRLDEFINELKKKNTIVKLD